MARFKGCRMQLPDGRWVPIPDTELDKLMDLFAISAQISIEAGIGTQSALELTWACTHAKYLAERQAH